MDYAPWLSREYWSVKTFLFLCDGKNPAEQPHVVAIRTGYIGAPPTPRQLFENQIDRAGKEGALVPRCGATADLDNWEFPPLEIIRFALSTGFEVPQPMRDFAAKKRTPARKRKRRITYAIERARGVLKARQKREPTAREVFKYLAESDGTGVIVDSDMEAETLTWETKTGAVRDTTFNTVQNILTTIRKNPG